MREVWTAFADAYRWVVGVQGNHDRFGTDKERARFEALDRIHLLDGTLAELDGISIGGVGKIIGDPEKPGRRSAEDFLAAIDLVAETNPDLLVLHHGPQGDRNQRGGADIRDALKSLRSLVVCGHCHWDEPLHQTQGGP